MERVMAVAQGPAELVAIDVHAIVDEVEAQLGKVEIVGTSPIASRCIIRFGDLYLVQDSDDDCWYMGMARSDGVIHCWAGYGQDLEEAITGL